MSLLQLAPHVEGDVLRVVNHGEALVKLLLERFVALGEISDELPVDADQVSEAVVPDQGDSGLAQASHDSGESTEFFNQCFSAIVFR